MDIVQEVAGRYREVDVARYLKTAETRAFLDQAKNVIGWEGR